MSKVVQSSFRVNTDVKIPTATRAGRRIRYPFADLNIGDSFAVIVPSDDLDLDNKDDVIELQKRLRTRLSQIAASAAAYGKAKSSFATTRRKFGPGLGLTPDSTEDFAEKYGVRCWRIEASDQRKKTVKKDG